MIKKNKITTNYNKILHETTKEGDDLYGKRDIPLCFLSWVLLGSGRCGIWGLVDDPDTSKLFGGFDLSLFDWSCS